MSKVTFKQGRKAKTDKIVLYDGIPMTFYDWIHMGLQFFKNENAIYPPPRFKGGMMLLEALYKICKKGHMDPQILKEYKIPHEKHTTNHNGSTSHISL